MDFGLKKILYMTMGLIDYVKEKTGEFTEELIERGEEKEDDIKEFLDDIKDKIPFFKNTTNSTDEEDAKDENGSDKIISRLSEFVQEINVKELITDLCEDLGLATKGDLEDINTKLERIDRKFKKQD